jgi:hypothetical protein
VVGQRGQRVLVGQSANGLDAASEQAAEAVSRVRGDKGAAGQRGAGQTGQHPELIHDAREGAVRRPTEPADYASVSIVQRLRLAIGGRRRIGCEAQILEAGGALDEPKLAVPEAVAFAEYRMNLVDGEPQRRVPLAAQAAIVQADDDKGRCGANDDRRTQDRQQQRGDTRSCGDRQGFRLVRAPPLSSPTFPGCRCGHTHAPHHPAGSLTAHA